MPDKQSIYAMAMDAECLQILDKLQVTRKPNNCRLLGMLNGPCLFCVSDSKDNSGHFSRPESTLTKVNNTQSLDCRALSHSLHNATPLLPLVLLCG